MKGSKRPAEDTTSQTRKVREEIQHLRDLHEPPMPSPSPAVTPPPERRARQRRVSTRGPGRAAGRRNVDALGKRRFIV